MTPTNRTFETALLVTTAVILTLVAVGSAAAPALDADGWHSWRVDAVDGAPNFCCYVWNGDEPLQKACNLDNGHQGFSSSSGDSGSPDKINIFVRIESGTPSQLRALGNTCPVTAASKIIEHGDVAPDESVSWLAAQVRPDGPLASEALAAIAVHAGSAARRTLVSTARTGASLDIRKDAAFWMGQARAAETQADLRWLMFSDPSADMRAHTAFAWSQSDLENRGAALAELGRTDESKKVRGQAWFWLTQTEDASSEAAILEGLASEKSRSVRNEAVFALSQLPGDRGVEALVAIIENRNMGEKDRKQALFWLAQSDSKSAMDYLARVLD